MQNKHKFYVAKKKKSLFQSQIPQGGKMAELESLKLLCRALSAEGPAERRLRGAAVSQHHPSVRLEDVFYHRCKGVSLEKPSSETLHEVSLLTSVELEELVSKCELPISIFRYFYIFSFQ